MGFRDGSGISWTIYKQSAPRFRQITTSTPGHSVSTLVLPFWYQLTQVVLENRPGMVAAVVVVS